MMFLLTRICHVLINRMKYLFTLLFFILMSTQVMGRTEILPAIFYSDSQSHQELCRSPQAMSSTFWQELMSSHIDELLEQAALDGIEHDVFKNQLVTLSYLGLSRISKEEIQAMNYVYANASHHLGRLIRFHYWQRFNHLPLGREDQTLISGRILGVSLRILPLMVSGILMSHSFELYKNLSWSMAAATLCGKTFVQDLLKDYLPEEEQTGAVKHLKAAFNAFTQKDFIINFVAFEQTYLQSTMYTVPEIRLITGMGILDKMRFIPFNGQKNLSFYEWCRLKKCRKTSLDLKKRILFDQTVILNELKLTGNNPTLFEQRLKKTHLHQVSEFIFNDLFPNRLNDQSRRIGFQH